MNAVRSLHLFRLAYIAIAALFAAPSAQAAAIALPDGYYDHVTVDPAAQRLYIGHAGGISVVDLPGGISAVSDAGPATQRQFGQLVPKAGARQTPVPSRTRMASAIPFGGSAAGLDSRWTG